MKADIIIDKETFDKLSDLEKIVSLNEKYLSDRENFLEERIKNLKHDYSQSLDIIKNRLMYLNRIEALEKRIESLETKKNKWKLWKRQ